MSFAERLEDRSALLYERLSEQFPAHADLFKSFARENTMNKVLLTRTYQETVTDALETGFSFEGLNLNDAIPGDVWTEHQELSEAVNNALVLERASVAFYANIAERARTLLSTIYTAFNKVERARRNRLPKLESLKA
jgi:hypothetical protein